MKVFKVVGLTILLIESALALSFWGGTVWIGGWQGGVILLSAALTILVLPWIGKLELEYNVLKCIAHFKVGWIGEIRTGNGPDRESHFRFLFLKWKTSPESRKGPNMGKRFKMPEFTGENLEPLSRIILPFIPALNEIIWESDELSLKIQAPTQNPFADQTLEKLLGRRWIGPLYLKVVGEGEREILVRFRIGLLKGIFISLYAFLQAHPSKRTAAIKR